MIITKIDRYIVNPIHRGTPLGELAMKIAKIGDDSVELNRRLDEIMARVRSETYAELDARLSRNDPAYDDEWDRVYFEKLGRLT